LFVTRPELRRGQGYSCEKYEFIGMSGKGGKEKP